MANRPYFVVADGKKRFYLERDAEFKYAAGFALSQKQKCIDSLHDSILKDFPNARILEISSKSRETLGIELSAFNLKYQTGKFKGCSVESLYQGSKVFVDGGPYTDLYKKTSREAKKDDRLRNSGDFKGYEFDGSAWAITPVHFFYDYLYVKALQTNPDLCEQLNEFDIFTDIEFNPKKSLNCQARAAAIYITLARSDRLDLLEKPEEFKREVYRHKL